MIKKIAIGILSVILVIAGSLYWAYGLIDRSGVGQANPNTQKTDVPYIQSGLQQNRGKVLAILTSHGQLGEKQEGGGFELTELSRAYYVFEANGFDVDLASPQGGEPPMVVDEGLNEYDYAFLNDTEAMSKARQTIRLKDVVPEDYQAIYLVGGKGTMFDFPDNPHLIDLIEHFYQHDKTIAAVCHGPVALLNAKNRDGESILKNKQITAFTNNEELLLIPDAKEIFPFLLQDALLEQGARFKEGEMYLDNTIVDGNLITGQNPWSTWSLAEATVKQMGYAPLARNLTAEEHAINALGLFHNQGKVAAIDYISYLKSQGEQLDRNTILMHGVIAFMKFEVLDGLRLLWFVSEIKKHFSQ